MKFRRARFSNFRLLRDIELDFSVDPKRPLTVIRAENETGKTTILNALQWVLFGEEGLPTGGTGYRIIPIDWEVSVSNTADIIAELEFEHTFERPDGKGGWIESTDTYLARRNAVEVLQGPETWRRFDESFELFRKGDSGYTPVKGGELLIRQILGSNLKDLFFTDGDRALSFITSEMPVGEKRRIVKRAIRDMLGFELLENSATHARNALAQIRSQAKEFPGSEEVARAEGRIRHLEEQESKNEKRLSEIDTELKQIDADINMIEQKLERALEKGNREDLIKHRQIKQDELTRTRTRLESVKQEHSGLFRRESLGQFLLKDHITKAGQILDDLKAKGRIPRTAIPILRERLDMRECICGESLDPGTPRYQRIENLIVQQEAASAVDDRLTELRYIAVQKLSQLSDPDNSWTKQMRSIIERRNDLERQIETLEAELKAVETKISELPETDIGFLREQRKQRLEYRDSLTREQSVGQSDRDKLARAKKLANDEWNALTARQKRYERVRCRVDAANDILDVIATSYKTIEESEITRVCSAMNEYFLNMIQADPENSIIRRADITEAYDIAVYGPEDRHLDTDLDLNGASRRALTLAFILALTEVSGVKAPNVIDTPLGMMSGIVKQSVLRTTVDHTEQLVLFLTRDELFGCQDIIDLYAGKVCTLTNSAHYPKQLVNDPNGSYKRLVSCDCNHHQYCNLCERIGDSGNPSLSKR